MVTVIKTFHHQNFNIEWINAISRIGYLSILYEPGKSGDFSSLWLLADKMGQFLRNDDGCKASAIAFHYFECENKPKKLFVIPRFPDEYSDHNEVYNISESDNQPETSSSTVIEPLAEKLINHLKL